MPPYFKERKVFIKKKLLNMRGLVGVKVTVITATTKKLGRFHVFKYWRLFGI
jgi:hypothetical protein